MKIIDDKYREKYRLIEQYEASGYCKEMRITDMGKQRDKEEQKVREWYALGSSMIG